MSRIELVKTHMISVPRPQPVWTAHEQNKAWNVILTELRTDDGLVGYGQIHGAPMPRICEWVARFGEIVRGMDALGQVAVWEKLFALDLAAAGRDRGAGGYRRRRSRAASAPQAMAAIAGIDIALWDIKGKAAGVPVYRLLGGENRPLFTYATGGYYRPGATNADYAGEMARMLRHGYRAVKLKTGAGSVAEEAERIATVRREIGNEPLLMLDMNAAYDLPDCIDFAHMVEPSQHLLARGAAALVSAAGRFRPARGGDADPAGAWRARADPVHGARLHRRGRHPLCAVRCDARRRLYRGIARSPRWPSSTGSWSRRIPRPNCTAIWCWRCRAAPLASKGMAGPRKTRWVTGLFKEHPELRDGHLHLGDKPGFGLEVDWAFVDKIPGLLIDLSPALPVLPGTRKCSGDAGLDQP